MKFSNIFKHFVQLFCSICCYRYFVNTCTNFQIFNEIFLISSSKHESDSPSVWKWKRRFKPVEHNLISFHNWIKTFFILNAWHEVKSENHLKRVEMKLFKNPSEKILFHRAYINLSWSDKMKRTKTKKKILIRWGFAFILLTICRSIRCAASQRVTWL